MFPSLRTVSFSGSDSLLHMKSSEEVLAENHKPALSHSTECIEASNAESPEEKIKRQASIPSFFSRRTKGLLRKTTRKLVKSVGTITARKRASRRSDTTASFSPAVRALSPVPGQDWDPTCLLEELYSDYRRVTRSGSSVDNTRHCGYLEKLPVIKTKRSVLKGYKRRYFRAIEGYLYYYEDLHSSKALGFIRLEDCKIVFIPEKLQLHVVESGGKVLVVRALNHVDLSEWKRAIQLESLHPTNSMTAPSAQEENPVLIVDIGGSSVRAGLGGDDAYPELFFPAVCSIDSSMLEFIDCGLGALLPENRFRAKLIYPRRGTARVSRKSTENNQAIVDIVTMVLNSLGLESHQCSLILTMPPVTPETECAELAEALLGNVFQFRSILFQEQALLALYSYNTTTGIIIDIGDRVDIIPVIDGYPIEGAINRLPFAGNAISEYLTKLLTAEGIRYFSQTETYINRYIKENSCFVSANYAEDCISCEANPVPYSHQINVDRFQLSDHRKAIVLNSVRFKASEGLFNPSLWGKDVPSIQELVWRSVQACPIDSRKLLLRNIFLSGGTSLLSGLSERLKSELMVLAPVGTTVEIHASEHRQHAAYLGASVLSRLTSFEQSVVSLDEWNLKGPKALKKWKKS